MKKISFLFLAIFLISFTSALAVSPDNFETNKTYNQPVFISISITNHNNFDMFNLTSSSPTILDFNEFDISAGENKTIQAEIKTNSDFNGTIEIQGEYLTNIGQSNKTEIVNIDSQYSNYVDICNIEIIKGDSINWINNVVGTVQIKNFDTNEIITEINGDQNHSESFPEQETIRYQIYRLGSPFSPVCEINVLNDEGLVHSNQYDAELSLDIKINYEPTSISTNFLSTQYTINFNGEKEDIFSITNTGNEIGRPIHLSGEWIEFDKNDFNLAIGESVNVGYTIRPFIFLTNETNRTHIKTIKIEGNFETVEKNLEITIPFKQLSSEIFNTSYDEEFMKNYIAFVCDTNPEWCPTEQVIIGNGQDNFTVVFTQESFRNFIESFANWQDRQSLFEKNITEQILISNQNDRDLNNSLNNQTEEVRNWGSQSEGTNAVILTIIIILIIAIVGTAVLLWLSKNKGLDKVHDSLPDGEKPW